MKLLPLLAALLAAAGCAIAPVRPVPDPLPETLAWAIAPSAEARGAFLGLKTRENDSGTLDSLHFAPGVRVTRVVEGSPAEGAGIQVGDVLLTLGGERTDDPDTLEALVAKRSAGASVALELLRGSAVFGLDVTLEGTASDTAPAEVLFLKDASRSLAGWATGPSGVVLVSAHPDSPFPEAGVEVGSVVTALDGEPVHAARGLVRRLQSFEPGERVEVAVLGKDGSVEHHDVELYEPPTKVTGFMIPILMNYDADVAGESTSFVLIDLYVISLFRYTRTGAEKEYRFLRWFQFSSGVGELSE